MLLICQARLANAVAGLTVVSALMSVLTLPLLLAILL